VDTIGLLLIVVVHTANIQDRDGAKLVLEQVKDLFPRFGVNMGLMLDIQVN